MVVTARADFKQTARHAGRVCAHEFGPEEGLLPDCSRAKYAATGRGLNCAECGKPLCARICAHASRRTQVNDDEPSLARDCYWYREPTAVPLVLTNRSKHTGRPCALFAKSGLVATFLAGVGAGVVAQSAHADGIVRCWGYNANGACNSPADLGICSSTARVGSASPRGRPLHRGALYRERGDYM